jgi:hypothetical protein
MFLHGSNFMALGLRSQSLKALMLNSIYTAQTVNLGTMTGGMEIGSKANTTARLG